MWVLDGCWQRLGGNKKFKFNVTQCQMKPVLRACLTVSRAVFKSTNQVHYYNCMCSTNCVPSVPVLGEATFIITAFAACVLTKR